MSVAFPSHPVCPVRHQLQKYNAVKGRGDVRRECVFPDSLEFAHVFYWHGSNPEPITGKKR
jgi:hypothetical protein